MKVEELIEKVKSSTGAQIVYAAPYEKDGITVIPAASIASGAGGGDGFDKQGQRGEGGGYGLAARPTGAYVIKDGKLRWEPAVDVNRLIGVLGAVVIAALFFGSRIAKTAGGRASAGARLRRVTERGRRRLRAG